jgi:Helix-turn-helix domain
MAEIEGRAAELIREFRQAAGLSQRQPASSARVSIGVVRDLEQHRTTRPPLSVNDSDPSTTWCPPHRPALAGGSPTWTGKP